MKNFLFILTSCICLAACKKHHNQPKADNPYGLPNATQSGKNTLGFLLNGEPWTPKGYNGTANLSIDFDERINNGIVGIVSYRTVSASDKTQFILGIDDSLNFKSAPFSLSISISSAGGLSFSTKTYCDILHTDATVYQTGNINITRLDRSARIISGTFEGVLFKQTCGDTLKITNGRFDMKY